MTDELFGDRRRGLENEYFRKRELEIREKLLRRQAEEATRQRMAERTGVADEEILRDLQALGYSPETVMLLHLVPLLQVAWAEGAVDDRERELIVKAARSRGVDEGSAADRQLAEWLKSRPSADFFEGTLRAIGTILHVHPPDQADAEAKDLLSYPPRSRRRRAACSASGRSRRRNARCWPTSARSSSARTVPPRFRRPRPASERPSGLCEVSGSVALAFSLAFNTKDAKLDEEPRLSKST